MLSIGKILPPPPCDYGASEPWEGPKTWEFCGEDVDDLMYDCPSCCFTIIYYDRFVPDGQSGFDYQVNVTAVFYDCPGPQVCDVENVIDAFYDKLLKYKAENDPRFWEDGFLGDPCLESSGYGPDLFTTGKCMNSQTGQECEPSERCCQSGYYYHKEYIDGTNPCRYRITETHFELIIYMWPECLTPPCTEERCRTEVMYQPLGTIVCDIDCNMGIWGDVQTSDPIDMTSFGCPGCEIQIQYRTRETNDPECSPQFTDIEILNIYKYGCSSCNLTLVEFYEFAIDWVLKYVAIENLQPGDCETNWRVLSRSCWRMFYDYIYPCGVDDCCYAIYIVCRDYSDNITYHLIELGPETTGWSCGPASACELICDAFPDPKIGDNIINFESIPVNNSHIIKPNPTTGEVNIIIENNFKGKTYLIISDVTGKTIINREYEKKQNELQFLINLKHNSDGIYFYKITNGINILESGSIIKK